MGEKFVKLLGWFIAICAFFISAPFSVRAAGEFETSYDVTYEVREDALCNVRQEISLTNKTGDFYALEHSLNLGKEEITDIWAQDSEGPLTPEVSKSGEDTLIKTIFSRPVVGEGKTLVWNLGYQSTSSRKWGGLLRLDIPGIKKDDEISAYKLRIKVPKTFGRPAFISPLYDQDLEEDNFWVFEFEKDKLVRGGIRAGFGDRQVFDFNLKYYLKNPEKQKAYLEVALPPDIAKRQKIIFKEISPTPESIRIDKDGNYLAKFLLEPEESKTVVVSGQVAIFHPSPSPAVEGKREDLPKDLIELYTSGDDYWEIESGEIKERVQALTRPEKTVFENVRSIYEYVVAHLSYDEGRMGKNFERFGAAKALKDRNQALCTEYADLFVTLCRAAGIPARVLEGYAYTEDSQFRPILKDVLHSWAEVYIPQIGWWQVDPTWGSTTGGSDYLSQFDLSHFVFAIKGIDSETPYPAGTYKWDDGQEGLIDVLFSEEELSGDWGQVRVVSEIRFSKFHLSGFPAKGRLIVKNEGSQSAFDVSAKVVAFGATLKSEREISLGTIPPWSKKEISVKLFSPWYRDTESDVEIGLSYSDFSGRVSGEVLKHAVHFVPFWRYVLSWWLLLPLGIVLLGSGVWIAVKKKLAP